MTSLIDPTIARIVARRVAGDPPIARSYLMDALRRDLDEAVPRSEELVAAASGIAPPAAVRWGLIDRAAWAEANITGMTMLLAPLTDKVAGRLASIPLPVRLAQRVFLSTEIGVLLGYVSRRVLGQYDVLVPETAAETVPRPWSRRGAPPAGTTLYFVGPNMVETERRYSFVPADFALWVALHEVTHRFQFAGVPWLKEHFLSLVHGYLSDIQLDARELAARAASAARRLLSPDVPPEERNPIYLLASPEQRRTLDRIQALMAVVEGHGNYVMDAVGAKVIPSFRRMRHVFDRRREQTTSLQRAVNHVLGLEMKLRQYELGQAFCEEVAAGRGAAALSGLWESPDALPTLHELREPKLWLRRVA